MPIERTPESDFSYHMNTLPSKAHQSTPIQRVLAPRNWSNVKMYLLFVIGSLALVVLYMYAISGIEYNGWQTYWQYFAAYWQKHGSAATVTMVIMLVINIFWIVVSNIINFLAIARSWIPPKRNHSWQPAPGTETPELLKKKKGGALAVIGPSENQVINEKKQQQEDDEEFEAILRNPVLSPFAFLWAPTKASYRGVSRLPDRMKIFWAKLTNWFSNFWENLIEFLANLWELIVYFLNPFNFLDEVMDIAIIVLVRFLYPAILTPLIFFLTAKASYIFGSLFDFFLEILVYFFIIGALRLGVEFFSIYIRFLRNSR